MKSKTKGSGFMPRDPIRFESGKCRNEGLRIATAGISRLTFLLHKLLSCFDLAHWVCYGKDREKMAEMRRESVAPRSRPACGVSSPAGVR